jgi:predicted transcriptional regulator
MAGSQRAGRPPRHSRMKATSLRLDEELATELQAVARAEGVPVSEAIRAALYQYVTTCRADPGFQARFQKQLEEEREALERLASWGKGDDERESLVLDPPGS